MSTTDTTRFDQWDSEIDSEQAEKVERQLVRKHDGGVVCIPEAIAASILGDYLDDIEGDIRSGEITQETVTRYVYAQNLHNAVSDDWNGRWK